MKYLLAIFGLAAAISPLYAGVLNPGFETGDFTGWTSTGTGNVSTSVPRSGLYSALFDGPNDVLTQTVATTPSDVYSLSFWLADFGPGNPPNGTFEVDWDHQAVMTFSSTADIAYTEYVIHNLTATTASTDVTFMFGQVPVDAGLCSSPTPGTWSLDDVTVFQGNGDPPDVAPEPASLVLAALAGAGLVALNFRRK